MRKGIFSVRNVANVVPPLVVKRKKKMMKDHGTVSAIECGDVDEKSMVVGHLSSGDYFGYICFFAEDETSEKTKDDDDDVNDDGAVPSTRGADTSKKRETRVLQNVRYRGGAVEALNTKTSEEA